MTSSLRQPRLPVLETWIEELLIDPNAGEESGVSLVEHERRDGAEPILASTLRPRAFSERPAETLRPTSSSLPPARTSDPRELSPLLEGDELDLLRFVRTG